ncbi:G domain-containing protein [Prescottella defluvii]
MGNGTGVGLRAVSTVGTVEDLVQFGRFAAGVGGEPLRALDLYREPIRIQVVGRAGSGRTTTVRLLERAGFTDVFETAAVDAPGTADPELDGDVVVYVLAGGLRTPDVEALRRAPSAVTVAILGKADMHGSWAAAWAAVACTTETGVPTVPMGAGPNTSSAPVGVDDMIVAVAGRVRNAQAARTRTLLRTLAETAARGPHRDAIEQYLRSDEAVSAAARSAAARSAGAPPDGPANRHRAESAVRRARVRDAVRTAAGRP